LKKVIPTTVLTRSIKGWGVSARLEANDDEVLRGVLRTLPAGFESTAIRTGRGSSFDALLEVRAAGRQLQLKEAGLLRFQGTSRRALGRRLADALETLASTSSRTFAFLHAGGVEVDGRVILLPGRSHAGKSTLVTAFLKRGARYLSDDMVPVDSSLRAWPFPRPLGIRSAPGRSPTRTPIRSIGGVAARVPLPIALVWCGRYKPGVRRPSFKRHAGLAAFAQLLAQSPGAQIRPEIIMPILVGLARGTSVFSGVRGEAEPMVDALLKRLETI
jgi:hypothetical protein